MIKLTRSFREWLFANYPSIFIPVTFGHTELITDEIYNEYLAWVHSRKQGGITK